MGGLPEKTMNYQHLALLYDEIMGDHEGVDRYAHMLQSVLAGDTVLDLACGTGDLTVKLSDLGYIVTGLDISQPMLDVAKSKDHKDKIRFIQWDMFNLDLEQVFDNIVCANDSVNYCSSLSQLNLLFSGINRHLTMGGIFVFDVHQTSRLSEFEDPFDEEGVVGDTGYWWHIESDPPLLRHSLTFYGNNYPVVEIHEQYIFELSDLQILLQENGFRWEMIKSSDHDDLYLDEKWMIKAIKEKSV